MICGFEFVNQNNQTVLTGEVTLVNVKIQTDRQSIKAEAFDEVIREKIKSFLSCVNLELLCV